MSDELPSAPKLGPPRSLHSQEKALLLRLLRQANKDASDVAFLDLIQVQEMPDGGMGSLYLIHPSKGRNDRRFERRIAEIKFADSDGVDVIASLNVDQDGDLFELDMWKTDFTPLIRLSGDETRT